MFYEKDYVIDKPTRRRYKLSSFKGYDASAAVGTLPCDYCNQVYNFGFEDGKLTCGKGLGEFVYKDADGTEYALPEYPEGYENANLFCGRLSDENGPYDCFVLSADDKACVLRPGKDCAFGENFAINEKFTSAISYLHGNEDVMLLAGGGKGLFILGREKGEYVADALAITDLCTHYERVYAVVDGARPSVWFSDAFDPYNWNVSLEEGGYIQLDGSLGKVLRVISFADYVFIFCEYGIYRLTAFADQLQFSVKRVHCDCGRIYKDSICVCGTLVLFATFDGLYCLDGYDVKKLTDRVDTLIEGVDEIRSAYCRGVYYMSFSKEHEDAFYSFTGQENGDNVLVAVYPQKAVVEIYRGFCIKNLAVLAGSRQNCVLVNSSLSDRICVLDDSGSIFDDTPFRYWEIRDIDFGEHVNKKFITGVDYCTEKPYILGIVADGEKREFELSPQSKYRQINVSGVCFDFYIKSDVCDIEIKPPSVTVDFVRRAQ